MKFRWSGAVSYSEEEARQRIRHYFEQIGFRTLEETPTLSLQRGDSGWRIDPRQIWMQVDAKIHGWGSQTLVDVTFELASRRWLTGTGAELLVSEVREMVRYLEEGNADFERLDALRLQAIRELRQKGRDLLLFGGAFVVGLLSAVVLPAPPKPFLEGLMGLALGFLAGYLVARLLRSRKR